MSLTLKGEESGCQVEVGMFFLLVLQEAPESRWLAVHSAFVDEGCTAPALAFGAHDSDVRRDVRLDEVVFEQVHGSGLRRSDLLLIAERARRLPADLLILLDRAKIDIDLSDLGADLAFASGVNHGDLQCH